MQAHVLHAWNLPAEEARQLQTELASRLVESPLAPSDVHRVAGSDISFDAQRARASDAPVFAGFVILRLPEFTVVEQAGVQTISPFPYIPGLLSFREIPPLLQAWEQLTVRPDVLLADGHGKAHPRRFGLACHLGLVLDVPTISVAKSLFVGTHDPVPDAVGAWSPLIHQGEVVGAALRTRVGATPIYVSPGHRMDLPSALAIVLRCVTRYRLPETTRHAHAYVNQLRKAAELPENR